MSSTNIESTNQLPTGYYVKGEDELRNNPNEQYEDAYEQYDDAHVFLCGSCQLFALALHEKYGYPTLRLETKLNENAHYFCQSNYNGKTVYIDVRGITDDLNQVISRFLCGEFHYDIVPYNFVDEKILSKADEHGLNFARQIIADNPEVYDVNKLAKCK